MVKAANVIGQYRWTICGLLFFASTVNYLDRQVFSLLAPDLMKEFSWSNTDYADIASVFQFVYAISMLFAGRFIDYLGTKRAYLLAIFVWSIGAIIHAFAVPMGASVNAMLAFVGIGAVPVSIAGFMIARAVLAVGEAGNVPAAVKTTAEYFPKKERSIATGIFNSGCNIGAILAPLTVPWIAGHWGWEYAFIMVGVTGFAWMVAWEIYYDKPAKQKRVSKEELAYIHSDEEAIGDGSVGKTIPWKKLFTYRQTWAFVVGKFLTDGVWFFFLIWLPNYLFAQYGMSKTDVMLPLAVLYSMTMVGSVGGGWIPTYFINKGDIPYNARMKAMLLVAILPLVVLLAQPLGIISFWFPVVLIGIGASAHQAWSANLYSTTSDFFPKHSVASVVGIGGMAGSLGAVVITKASGWMFDYYAGLGHIQTGYTIMFSFCAVAYLLAWLLMKALVPIYKPVRD